MIETGTQFENSAESALEIQRETFVKNIDDLAETLQELSKKIPASSREDLKGKATTAVEEYFPDGGRELKPIAALFGESGRTLLRLLGVPAERMESFTNDSDARDFFELLGIPDGERAWNEVEKLLPALNELLE